MTRKNDGKRLVKARASSGTALVPANGAKDALMRMDDAAGGGAVFRQAGVTLVAGGTHRFGDREVAIDAAYYVGADGDRGEAGPRPGLGNADKLAWRDEATGYECIIMRHPLAGFLRGFVGVEPGHPLHGFDHGAIPPDLDVEVHGGITYSAVCQDGPSPRPRLLREAYSICHVRVPEIVAPVVDATDHPPAHDAVWWFGFDCNHLYDRVPGRVGDRARFLSDETGRTFRDEAYVYDQVVDLAAQLKAIADGGPRPERVGAPPPPLGLDARRAG